MRQKISEFKNWFLKYEKRLSAGALLAGFLFDALTLQRIDLLYENLVFITHLVIVGLGIILINTWENKDFKNGLLARIKILLPVFVQFSFGALFSGFFIFYSRSASILSSWPFILMLLILLIGNERFRDRYKRLPFQIGIYFTAIFSYFIFFIPVLVNRIGTWVFLLSGFLSFVVIRRFIQLLGKFKPQKVRESRVKLNQIIIGILVIINIFYFTNIIPPIPLSLKEEGIYNYAERLSSGEYILQKADRKWYEYFSLRETIKVRPGGDLYFYSAIFSPSDLNARVTHEWQYFDESRDNWITASVIPFSIYGGRDGGYRGFTIKGNVFEGDWRVKVKTGRKVLGIKRFNVEVL